MTTLQMALDRASVTGDISDHGKLALLLNHLSDRLYSPLSRANSTSAPVKVKNRRRRLLG